MKAKRTQHGKMKRKRRAPRLMVPKGPLDLDALNRAVFTEEDRRTQRKRNPGSVEDPLQDWPESSGEADRWLGERGKRNESPDR